VCALAAVEDEEEEEEEEEAKKFNSLLFSSLATQDLQPLPQRFAARNTHFPNIPALLVVFSPPSQLDKEEEEKRLSTTILLETTDPQTNRLADTHTHTRESCRPPGSSLVVARILLTAKKALK